MRPAVQKRAPANSSLNPFDFAKDKLPGDAGGLTNEALR